MSRRVTTWGGVGNVGMQKRSLTKPFGTRWSISIYYESVSQCTQKLTIISKFIKIHIHSNIYFYPGIHEYGIENNPHLLVPGGHFAVVTCIESSWLICISQCLTSGGDSLQQQQPLPGATFSDGGLAEGMETALSIYDSYMWTYSQYVWLYDEQDTSWGLQECLDHFSWQVNDSEWISNHKTYSRPCHDRRTRTHTHTF